MFLGVRIKLLFIEYDILAWIQIYFIEYKYFFLNIKYFSLNIDIFLLNPNIFCWIQICFFKCQIFFIEYKYFGLNTNLFYWMRIHFLKYQIFFMVYKYNFIEYENTFLLQISNHTYKHPRNEYYVEAVARTSLRHATLLKERLSQRCFTVNFAKFLRTSLFTELLRWLLLFINKYCLIFILMFYFFSPSLNIVLLINQKLSKVVGIHSYLHSILVYLCFFC